MSQLVVMPMSSTALTTALLSADRPHEDVIHFGPFSLSPGARTLDKDGAPVQIGSRALNILIVLIERAGEVVSHRELMEKVWRGLVVDDCNLRVNVKLLREVLRDGGACIHNVPGQGYSFIAPIVRANDRGSRGRSNLPPTLSRMIGREDTIRTLAKALLSHRCITLIGPGGMGKTTTAIAVAHLLQQEFTDGVCFIDLGAVSTSNAVTTAVAATLALPPQSGDGLSNLIEFLRGTSMLLVLDNCEHLIDGVAQLAQAIFSQTAAVSMLATSREALRVDGEHVHYLPPLSAPPPDVALNAGDAIGYPAVRLFVERAAAGAAFELTDDNASSVARICQRLDGIPLAIEFAASRAATHGIGDTLRLLDSCSALHWPGHRTALPRHRTMQAVLDWSHDLLPHNERLVLYRLAILVGAFTLEAAHAVASSVGLGQAQAIAAIEQLVAKSLVCTLRVEDGSTRYRLLETTRAYARIKLDEAGEAEGVAQRHAKYFAGPGETDAFERDMSLRGGLNRATIEHLGNVRAALRWCLQRERSHSTS